jgi:hypothetical protein
MGGCKKTRVSRGVKDMPLTKSGKKVMKSMKKTYGTKKGKSVFYASMNKKKKGSKKWEGKKKKK